MLAGVTYRNNECAYAPIRSHAWLHDSNYLSIPVGIDRLLGSIDTLNGSQSVSVCSNNSLNWHELSLYIYALHMNAIVAESCITNITCICTQSMVYKSYAYGSVLCMWFFFSSSFFSFLFLLFLVDACLYSPCRFIFINEQGKECVWYIYICFVVWLCVSIH